MFMKRSLLKLSVVFVIWVAGLGTLAKEKPDAGLKGTSRMEMEPCSASLAGGKAKLTTTALRRGTAKYTGNYDIKVSPYFFKSEKGTLSFDVSDESMRKLAKGTTVDFAGRAVTSGTGKSRAVKVKMVPAGAGLANGNLTIAIATTNGELVFRTEYTFGGS
jgi:hypothetical protein